MCCQNDHDQQKLFNRKIKQPIIGLNRTVRAQARAGLCPDRVLTWCAEATLQELHFC